MSSSATAFINIYTGEAKAPPPRQPLYLSPLPTEEVTPQ